MRTFALLFTALIAWTSFASNGQAAAITINNPYIFRATRGVNDVGIGQGDRRAFGTDVIGGSAGTNIAGFFTPTGSTAPTFSQPFSPCAPTSTDLNLCGSSVGFSPSWLNGVWQIELQQGSTTATFALPSVTGIPLTPVPSPTQVTIVENGINPTINWALPSAYIPNGLRIQIYDRSSSPLLNGSANIIHVVNVSPGTSSYTVPTNLSSSKPGQPVSLIAGHLKKGISSNQIKRELGISC